MRLRLRFAHLCRGSSISSTLVPVVFRLVSVACCVSPAFAIDLRDAFDLALQRDAKYRGRQADAAAVREKVPIARAQLLPSVSFSASRNQNNLTREKPSETQERYFSENQTLSLRQPLLRQPQWVGLAQAQAEVRGGEAALSYEKLDLLSRLTTAYAQALLSEDRLSLVRSKKASAVAQLDAAKKSFAAGSGTRTDVDEAKARFDMVIAEELEATQQLAYAREDLELIIDQKVLTLSRLDADQMRASTKESLTLEEWWTLAEADSPELSYLKSGLEVAQLEIERARAAHYPTLDAVAQVVKSSAENVTATSSNYRNRVLGLQLSVPLFAGGGVNASIRQAHARHASAEASLESTRRELRLRIHKEFRAVSEGKLRINALEQAVISSEEMLKSSQKSFAAGVRTLLDVFEAERAYQSALWELSQARYGYLKALVQLHCLSGQEPEKAIAAVNGWLR